MEKMKQFVRDYGTRALYTAIGLHRIILNDKAGIENQEAALCQLDELLVAFEDAAKEMINQGVKIE